MKTFQKLSSLWLSAILILLITSCTKNMDEQSLKGDREVGKFAATPCGPFIGLIGQNPTSGFFYIGDKDDVPNRQPFTTSGFTDDRYFKVTSNVGSPYYTGAPVKQIGVTDKWINAGEALWLELGSSFTTQMMQGFDLIIFMEGIGMAGAPSTGSIDLYNGIVLVHSIPLSSTTHQAVSYVTTGLDPKFNRIKISTTFGKMALSGRYPNVNFLGQTKFYLVPDATTFVFMQIASGTTLIGLTAYDNWFINYRELGVTHPNAERQNRSMGTSLAALSGEFPSGNPGKEWLRLSGGPGNTLVARYDNQRIGVNDQFINGTDTLWITPGADFPTSSFRSFEVREATVGAGPHIMKVDLWKAGVWVGGGNTTGVDATFNTFVGSDDFDTVTITHVSGFPSIGRLTPFGFAMRVYPGCL